MSKSAPSYTLNKSYNAPDADVQLVSSDNVIFKVHSFNLKAFSSVFREMLSSEGLGGGMNDTTQTSSNISTTISRNPSPTPIPIDALAADLEVWLDFMYKLEVQPTTWQRYHRVLKLSELFGTDIIGERVVYRLEGVAISAPWEIFCVASKYNLLPLAKACIRVFGSDPNVGKLQIQQFSFQMGEKCGLPYLIGIFRLMNKKEKTLDSHGRGAGVLTWESLANEFQPVIN